MTRIRKSMVSMSSTEWQTYNNAINQLIMSGKWHQLFLMHAAPMGNHRMHGSMAGPVGYARFLYWHRAYLVECENALREIDSSITIPYWDWLGSQRIPSGLNHMPMTGVIRNSGDVNFTDQAEIDGIMLNTTFDAFVFDLETNPHNHGHNWVGGIMSNPMDSPRDPLFYMHHAFIDKLFADWQAKPGNENKAPEVSDEDGLLDPWDEKWTIANTQDISNLGSDSYSYAPAPGSVNPRLFDFGELARLLERRSWPRPNPFPPVWPPRPPLPIPTPGPRPGPDPIWDAPLSAEEMGLIQFLRSQPRA